MTHTPQPEPLDVSGFQELLWSFARHRVVTVASKAGVLARLAEHTETPEQVAEALGLDPLATGKVVRALTALGILHADGDRYHAVDGLAPYLRPGPDDMAPFIAHSHAMYERWGASLEGWLRGVDAAPHGAQRDPAGFGAAMQAMGARVAKEVVARLDLGNVRRLLDVGGGFGHYSGAFLDAGPDITAVVLDRPDVADLGRAQAAGTRHAERLSFEGGTYLESYPGGPYDLVLLANVLHQEHAAEAARMVELSSAVLAPGGRVVVVDFAIDDEQRAHPLGTLFAINMRSFGDTWPEPRIRGWMEAAGLGDVQRIDLDRNRWIVVGRKG